MKSVFTICLLICFLFANMPAQQWVKINQTFNPLGNYTPNKGVFVDPNNGWLKAGPNASVFRTTNGGKLWVELNNKTALGTIEFIDTLHGWMVGRILPGNDYNIMITKDGGKSWNRYSTPAIGCLTFFDSLVGFAGGSNNIYKTIDGGITWDTMSIQSHVGKIGVYDIFFLDKKHGWTVGGGGALTDMGFILNTVDSGKTWQYIDSMTNINQAITFTDSLHGYAVGGNPPYSDGIIQVTSNGGLSWMRYDLPCSWLNDVVFTDDSTGWVVGEYGFIWHTTNQGLNWTQVESGTTSNLYRIFFFNNGETGYILGVDSTLLKYDNTVSIQDEHPEGITSYQIFQNYPNPFNPKTIITYQLLKSGNVTLKIFDILGNEIKIAVNEPKEIGKYTVQFDAFSLASGMYVYQLRVNDFISSKKMLLLK
ncbi:MAG: YCF48-related protein [Ignavibacteriaceae bacterium]|nr:YCF48-related protein [Ignavibacteriaceae bacterium]